MVALRKTLFMGGSRFVPLVGKRFLISLVLFLLSLLVVGCNAGNADDGSVGSVPELFRFTDVTDEAGIDFRHGAFRWEMSGDPVAMMGGGLCWLDFNNDGWLDLFAVNSYALAEAGRWESEGGLPGSALYQNNEGLFTDVSRSSGVDSPMRGNGCVAADLNLDGWTDIYVTTERENELFWNNGDGTFSPGAEAAGVNEYGWQTAATVGDLNADGWPDLVVSGYVDINSRIPAATLGFPNTHVGRRDLLYINEGIGPSGKAVFREVGVEAGLESEVFEYGLGALLTDLDRDSDLDLLIANDTNPNRLYENIPWPGGVKSDPEGIGFRFAEVGQYAKIGDNNSGMGVASGDYDNDGRFDLVITNLGQQLHSVYANESGEDKLIFEDATDEIGAADIGVGWTGWGISWADVDHDTDLDLIIANGSVPVLDPTNDVQRIQLFANLTAQGMPGLFQDLTELSGFNEIDPLLARGSAMADYDNDGDLDMAISTIGGRLVLLRNDQTGGNWLTVQLEGFQPGALVTVVLSDGGQILCEVHAGSSYLSTEDPRCHFGLGEAKKAAELIVRWPDGTETRKKNVKANEFVEIAKGEDGVKAAEFAEEMTLAEEDFLFNLMLREGGAIPMEVLPPFTEEMINLGRALFWDKELSGTRDVACVTCHHPLAGTGDGLSVSVGVGGEGFAEDRQLGEEREFIPRNATEIFNRGVEGWETMFWDARVSGTKEKGFHSPAGEDLPTGLENIMAVQAMFPVTSREEMRGDVGDVDVYGQVNELALFSDTDLRGIWKAIMDRLMEIDEYRDLFAAAFPDVPLEWQRFQHAADAIAAYEMSVFTHVDSPWDRFLAGEVEALSPSAKEGAALFFGEARCSECHNGSLLTDQLFHNIGVPQLGPGKGDEAPADFGRGRETGAFEHRFAFRTPPLRNVEVTGPWMHNGAYTALEGAVRHHLDPVSASNNYDVSQLDPLLRDTYQENSGVLQTLDPLIETPVELSDSQVADLLAFLAALTSPSIGNACDLIPDSVPSGLPIDTDPHGRC